MINWSNGTWIFLPVAKVEIVVATFERDDPAVEQFGGVDPLAAEVVDQQAAAVALELDRGFADVGGGVVANFEVVHRQFAADDDGGPVNLHPAHVGMGRLKQALAAGCQRFVTSGVEELHELAVFGERAGIQTC